MFIVYLYNRRLNKSVILYSLFFILYILLLVIGRTIQRRISDSVNFDRDWDDYVNGFGEEDGNYWMGLEEIHQLTTTHNVSLFIDIETFEGSPVHFETADVFCW